MSFVSITSGAKTFVERQPGTYIDSSLGFSSPSNEFRVKGASPKNKSVPLAATVVRRLDKDVTINSATVRKYATVQVIVTTPQDSTFTSAEIAAMVSDHAAFLTAANVSRLLQGES